MSSPTLDKILNDYEIVGNGRPYEIANFGRDNLAELFWKLNFKRGVEVGVAQGVFSETLMESNEGLTLYGVDPFEPHKGYRDYVRVSTFDKFKKNAHEKLDRFENYHFIEKYSAEAAKDFKDGSLDFVYIDGDHCYESVVADIATWLPKIKKGGIISGDDYFRSNGHSKMHVVDAVNGYTYAYGIKPWFVLGRSAKIPGEIRDSGRSWMWVVE